MGLAATGLLFSGLATGMGVYGQIQQGKAAVAAAQYNQKLAEAEAKNKEVEFVEGSRRARTNQDRQMSAIRARLANSGVQTTTGSPLDIFGDTASAFQTSVSDAARAANMQAAAMRQKGVMGLWEAKQQKSASMYAAFGTGLSGFSNMAGQYSNLKYQGAL